MEYTPFGLRLLCSIFISFTCISFSIASEPAGNLGQYLRDDHPDVYKVVKGDTLWDIARTIAPTGDISELVRELVRANGARIEAGQVVRIP